MFESYGNPEAPSSVAEQITDVENQLRERAAFLFSERSEEDLPEKLDAEQLQKIIDAFAPVQKQLGNMSLEIMAGLDALEYGMSRHPNADNIEAEFAEKGMTEERVGHLLVSAFATYRGAMSQAAVLELEGNV